MMYQKNTLEYAEISNDQIVDLPFAKGAFKLRLVLPAKGKDIDSYVDNLDYTALMMAQMQPKTVSLSVPRFKIDGSHLNPVDSYYYIGLGMLNDEKGRVSIFDNGEGPSFEVLQRNILEISEEGLIAALASWNDALILDRPSADQVTVTFDRPFLLFLMGPEDICLLAGKVGDL